LKESVTLYDLADAVDHICQITGSAEHAALGTNFDGGFGFESIPSELTTTADLPLLAIRLVERGYGMQEIEAILGGNWHRILRSLLPSA
jgi:membrane dipeptidase